MVRQKKRQFINEKCSNGIHFIYISSSMFKIKWSLIILFEFNKQMQSIVFCVRRTYVSTSTMSTTASVWRFKCCVHNLFPLIRCAHLDAIYFHRSENICLISDSTRDRWTREKVLSVSFRCKTTQFWIECDAFELWQYVHRNSAKPFINIYFSAADNYLFALSDPSERAINQGWNKNQLSEPIWCSNCYCIYARCVCSTSSRSLRNKREKDWEHEHRNSYLLCQLIFFRSSIAAWLIDPHNDDIIDDFSTAKIFSKALTTGFLILIHMICPMIFKLNEFLISWNQ